MRGGARSLRRRLAALLAVTAVLLLALVGTAAALLVKVHQDQDTVTKRYFTIFSDSTEQFVALVNAETAVRGFILTGNEVTLEPLQTLTSPEYQARAANLSRLVADDAPLRESLETTTRSANDWYASFVQPSLERIRTQGGRSVDADGVVAGKAKFDRIRADYLAYRNVVLERRLKAAQTLSARTDQLFVAVLLAAIGAVVFGVVLAIALQRWVTRPVETLARETRVVRSGSLSHPISVEGPPEIVALAEDVDLMRQRLLEQLTQVESVRDGLETAQSRLESQAAELERSNRDLEQFAYVASHDLQEPLRKVASFCQLLERRYAGQLDERADQYIAFAVDGAKRMQQLINDLLSFSRIGRRTTGRDEVALDACFSGAVRNLAAALEDSGAEVVADPLPAVWGEKALLTALLQNMLSNAVKFHGSDAVQVRLTAEKQGEEYVFSCSDNGIGIEPQYAERIFVIFQRLHAKDEYPGTGIGLALCKKIVEWHGGTIWLDVEASAPGTGTTFRWTLPTADRGRTLMDPAPDGAGEVQTTAVPTAPEQRVDIGGSRTRSGH